MIPRVLVCMVTIVYAPLVFDSNPDPVSQTVKHIKAIVIHFRTLTLAFHRPIYVLSHCHSHDIVSLSIYGVV